MTVAHRRSCHLSWLVHIQRITSDAKRTLGFLKRNLGLAPSQLNLIAFTSLVQPKLLYASCVWDTHQSYPICSLEAAQTPTRILFVLTIHSKSACHSWKPALAYLTCLPAEDFKTNTIYHVLLPPSWSHRIHHYLLTLLQTYRIHPLQFHCPTLKNNSSLPLLIFYSFQDRAEKSSPWHRS